jgi:hypothetical protein
MSLVASHLSINHNEAADPDRSTLLVVQLINPILSGWANYFAIRLRRVLRVHWSKDWVVAFIFVTARDS